MGDFKEHIHEVIFEAETPAGKRFDIALLVLIVISIALVMLESVRAINQLYGEWIYILEWVVTIFFTIEYLLRIYAVRSSWKYITSFFGVIDLLSIIPTYIGLFVAGSHYLLVVRGLRLLRVFRVLKLSRFLGESAILITALKASRYKITVFLGTVLSLATIIGAIMYLIEGEENGFTSIPMSIYWAIVTLTTVGFGDIAPKTDLGKFLATIVMIMGYGVIAVPTGIVSVELSQAQEESMASTRSCHDCGQEGHTADAIYCKYCGEKL